MAKKQKAKIRCAIIEAGGHWCTRTIDNDINALQSLVDGYVEHLPWPECGLAILVNEDGKMRNLPESCIIKEGRWAYTALRGTVVIAGVETLASGEEVFTDVPDNFEDVFPTLFHVVA